MTLGPVALRKWLNQLKLAFHQECGSPTANLPHPGKVVTALAGCGLTGNQAGISPLDEGFFVGGFIPTCHTQTFVKVAKLEH